MSILYWGGPGSVAATGEVEWCCDVLFGGVSGLLQPGHTSSFLPDAKHRHDIDMI